MIKPLPFMGGVGVGNVDMTGTKTLKLDIGIWFNQDTGHIHIAASNDFISTISPDPGSKRYHPNLYRKLATALARANLPHPNPSPEGEGLEQ